MRMTNTVIIGAGQAGLAMSRCLTDEGIDHVVLERGRVADSWRSRWDSLHLLTPNWMTRLPGYSYQGPEPDGFMTREQTVTFFEAYASSFQAPVIEGADVKSVTRDGFFRTVTDFGVFGSNNVVVATGDNQLASTPSQLSEAFDPSLHQVHSMSYRNPQSLPQGGVLVVGAGPSGLQIADELRRSGRRVVLAVGRHCETPRRYRGSDFWWWLETVGSLDETVDDVGDIDKARRLPSLGLSGNAGGVDLDLSTLARAGVEMVGRLVDTDGLTVRFGGNLDADREAARAALLRLLDRFDSHATTSGLAAHLEPPTRPSPLERWNEGSAESVDLDDAAISNVIWCTGFRRSYPWLRVPVLDDRGEIIQWCGVTPIPGLYVLGRRFQRIRRSHFIDGVGDDARYLASRIVSEPAIGLIRQGQML